MVQKEIEQTYEETEVVTETETVVFCDGCTEETEEYVTLSNISVGCLEQAAGSVPQVQQLMDNAEQFHFCSGCQRGLREHGRTIDTVLYDAPEEDEDTDDPDNLESVARMLLIGFLILGFGVVVGGMFVLSAGNVVGAIGMMVIGIALMLATLFNPSNATDRST